jgi:hypothetical protein
VISGFHGEADENCALLGDYAASSDNSLPRFGTTSQPHLQASLIHSWPLNMASIGCPEPWVWNYRYSLRNNPEERSSQKEDTNLCLTFISVVCIRWCTLLITCSFVRATIAESLSRLTTGLDGPCFGPW